MTERTAYPDKRELLVAGIASILDYPSVYMGGPSQQSRQKATRIVSYLEDQNLLRADDEQPVQP